MTETHYPVNGRITIYIYNHHAKPVRITATALTDLEGDIDGKVRISDWKMNEARTEITLTIVVDNGYHSTPFVRVYPLELKETVLPSPGRSFKWNEFGRCWQHRKTGVRVVNA